MFPVAGSERETCFTAHAGETDTVNRCQGGEPVLTEGWCMKRYETYWVLRGLLTTLVVSGMTMSASFAEVASHLEGCNDENVTGLGVAARTADLPLPLPDWESLSLADLCEMVLDDTSQDSMDDFHLPSQFLEHAPYCPEVSPAAGRFMGPSVGTGISARMISCVWRC